MKIKTVQDKVWAILPAKLEEIDAVICHYLNGGKPLRFEPVAYSVGLGSKIPERNYSYQLDDGVVMLDIYGTMAQRANLFTQYSGGVSTEVLLREFRQAVNDPAVTGILLNFDSPGGTVHGVKTFSDEVFRSRSIKPIVAYTDGQMCSAAYFVGSAASCLVASGTSQVGSIGVALTHYDYSKRDEKEGVQRTEIFAGKYKRMGSDNKPLDKESREYLQEMVNTYYTIFVETVARNRGVELDEALAMADGKVLIGNEALDAGLVDHIGNLETALAEITQTRRDSPMNFKNDGIVVGIEECNPIVPTPIIENPTHPEAETETVSNVVQEKVAEDLRDSEIAALKKELLVAKVTNRVEALVRDGKLTPAALDAGLVDQLAALPEASGEWFLDFFASFKPVVSFGHILTGDETVAKTSAEDAAALDIARRVNPDAKL